MNKPLVALKSNYAHDGLSSMGGSAANSEPDDISSPTIHNQDSMEISSEDEVMEDISREELQDEIEDGEMEAGTGMYFCLQNEEIEKFIHLRRQLKRSKNLWLAQNPEKLLLPDYSYSNHEPKTDDIQSFVESSVTVGRIFREALSRSGMDLVDHYKLLQEDPSKIPGALRFDTPTTNSDANDLSSTGYSDTCLREPVPQNQNLKESVQQNKLDDIIGHCEEKEMSWKEKELPPLHDAGNMIPPQTSPLSSVCQKNSLVTGEACWDTFSWSTGLTPTGESIDCMQSAKCNKNHHSSLKQGTEDIVGNKMSSLLGGMESCGHGSFAESHEALQNAEVTTVLQTNCPSSESIQSSVVVDHDMEAANQDDDVSNTDRQGTMHTAAVEESTLSCLSSETAVCHQIFPSGVEGLMKDSHVQAYQVEKKQFHLEELITGAVMAECQLHQKTFSHYDLEPLSRLLTAHLASMYQKQKTKVMVFKDLVDACSCAPEITLQRYFVALLSAAHQQNMGNLKDTRMEGLQILLEGGISGRLSELTINLSPCHSVPFA